MDGVQKGPYGYYYPYKGDDGKKKGIKIFDWVYDKYYEPGYLKDNDIERMLEGQTITFAVDSSSGTYSVTAKIIPYTTKDGRSTRIINFDVEDKIDDRKILLNNAEKIALSYYDNVNNRFDYTKPQLVVNKLNLTREWKTFATNERYDDHMFGTINIYRVRSRRNDSITLYCHVDKVSEKETLISEEEYKSYIHKLNAEIQAKADEYNKKRNERNKVVNSLVNYIDAIHKDIDSYSDIENVFDYIDNITTDITVSDIDSLVAGLVTSKKHNYLNCIFEDSIISVKNNINMSNYTDEKAINEQKVKFLKQLKIYNEYNKIINVRKKLWDRVNSEGLATVVDNVSVDIALDIGNFKAVQKILVKYKENAPRAIIFTMYENIIDPYNLTTNLLNLLKIYYDFYDMPEKDRQAVAKFIAKHKLSDYYEQISKYDDVLETLIDNSRDPRLTKPLLEGIAGTSRANVLKDKTYYFEKRGRLRGDILLYKPIELVERLREHIKEFNVSSGVAILTNIELDADESFIFQFYTFADGEGDEAGFDGRRMLNLTRIYNRYYPDQKIGFYFDNNSVDSE